MPPMILFLQFEFNQIHIGLVFATVAVAYLLFALIVGRLSDKFVSSCSPQSDCYIYVFWNCCPCSQTYTLTLHVHPMYLGNKNIHYYWIIHQWDWTFYHGASPLHLNTVSIYHLECITMCTLTSWLALTDYYVPIICSQLWMTITGLVVLGSGASPVFVPSYSDLLKQAM